MPVGDRLRILDGACSHPTMLAVRLPRLNAAAEPSRAGNPPPGQAHSHSKMRRSLFSLRDTGIESVYGNRMLRIGKR